MPHGRLASLTESPARSVLTVQSVAVCLGNARIHSALRPAGVADNEMIFEILADAVTFRESYQNTRIKSFPAPSRVARRSQCDLNDPYNKWLIAPIYILTPFLRSSDTCYSMTFLRVHLKFRPAFDDERWHWMVETPALSHLPFAPRL